MPNLKPPVTTTAAGARTIASASSPRCRRARVRAADDALPHRRHAARGDRAREAQRLRARRASSTRPARPRIPTPASPTSRRIDAVLEAHGRSSACRCWCTARSPTRRSTCSIARRVFIDDVLAPLRRALPAPARSCSSTSPRATAVQFVEARGANVAATITPHHLLLNRNALFAGGIRPHHYCLPVLKRETHREALRGGGDLAATRKFFLGTDSAPHARARQGSGLRLRRHLHRARRASSSTPRPSRPPARSTSSRASPADFGADFYGLPRNDATHHAGDAKRGPCRHSYPFGAESWCRCAPASASPGARAGGRAVSSDA